MMMMMMTKVLVIVCSWWCGGEIIMSYALPPRDNRRRTSRRRSQDVAVAMQDSFPCEELLDSDIIISESPILRSDDDNLIAKPIHNDDADAANDDETFSMSNSRLATRDDIHNNCKVKDAQQLNTARKQSIEQYGIRHHHNLILSSVVGVAIIGVSMIEGRHQQVVFTIVSILAILVIHNSLLHNESSRLSSSIASSPSENNRGLQFRWSAGRSFSNSIQSSMPHYTFEFGLRNNNAPATSSSHKTWRQLNTMTNNIITDPLLVKETKSSSSAAAVRPKELTQLLEERKSSSSILFASDSMTIKPPMQTLERLEKRNKTRTNIKIIDTKE